MKGYPQVTRWASPQTSFKILKMETLEVDVLFIAVEVGEGKVEVDVGVNSFEEVGSGERVQREMYRKLIEVLKMTKVKSKEK